MRSEKRRAPAKTRQEIDAQKLREQTKLAKRKLLAHPEFIAASVILALWTLLLIPLVHPVATPLVWLMVFGFGEGTLYLAVRDGSHGFLTFGAAYTLVLGVLTLSIRDWLMPVGLVLAGASALLLTDLIRLNFARRRGATLSPVLVSSTLLFSGVVAFVSLLSFGLLTSLADESADRSWIWVPVVSGVLVLVTGAVTFLLSRSSARSEIRTWKPGETMVPPPTGD